MKHDNVSVKIILWAKEMIVGILAQVFMRMVKQLKNIADITVILSDEIINVMDGVSINMTNSIPAN